MNRLIALSIVLSFFGACSHSYKPCTMGGETTWDKKIGGNMMCHQIDGPEGKPVNHGDFIYYYPNGKPGVKGLFRYGLREGMWQEFDDTGKLIREKYYEKGVEKPFSSEEVKKVETEKLKKARELQEKAVK